jgi:hypothetical protein
MAKWEVEERLAEVLKGVEEKIREKVDVQEFNDALKS